MLFIVFVYGCSRKPRKKDLTSISTKVWTYTSGYKIDSSDFLEFGSDGYHLKDDSIFDKNIFKGRIVRFNSKYREIRIETPEKLFGNYYNHDFK
jgi:hypothetical protein